MGALDSCFTPCRRRCVCLSSLALMLWSVSWCWTELHPSGGSWGPLWLNWRSCFLRCRIKSWRWTNHHSKHDRGVQFFVIPNKNLYWRSWTSPSLRFRIVHFKDFSCSCFQMFSDTTSLYWNNAEPKHPETNQDPHTHFDQSEPVSSLPSELFCSIPLEAVSTQDPFSGPDSSDFRLDLNRSDGSPNTDLRSSWSRNDVWREEEKLPAWSHRAAGRVVGRVTDGWTPRVSLNEFASYLHTGDSPLTLSSTFSCSPLLHNSDHGRMSPHQLPVNDHLTFRLSPPPDVPWGLTEGLSCSRGAAAASASYGSRSWTGLERKRSCEAAGLLESSQCLQLYVHKKKKKTTSTCSACFKSFI